MNLLTLKDYEWAMGIALKEAELAAKKNEVPIGACVLAPDGKVLSSASNFKEAPNDPTGHAEILAIKEASKLLSSWRLLDCTLVVTLEPCVMCMGALWQSRIKKLVFGAYDSKGGAISLGYKLHKDKRFNHNFSVIGGIRHYECSKILSNFFKQRRSNYNFKKI